MAREKPNEGKGDDNADLKSREYRDKDGNVHHHTKKYMEQHGKSGGGASKGSEGEE